PYAKPIAFDKKDTKIIAHRGLSGIEMENTVPAFRLAGNHSYYGIETDVHRASDGKYVVIHDDTTGRVALADFAVERTPSDVLRTIKLNNPYGSLSDEHYIPFLEEYIGICRQYGKISVLELKNSFEEADIINIAKIIESEAYLDKTIFISFDLNNLILLRRSYPSQAAQYLTCRYSPELLSLLEDNKLDLDIYYRELNLSRVKALHEKGITVNCWTVNSKRAATRLAAWGVDYITTNILE
ncbi:MAG: hypothetical protein EOM87_10400, partial [Clostridia bacterium]|nr:hypothetical protein [Clostridia bacterium]